MQLVVSLRFAMRAKTDLLATISSDGAREVLVNLDAEPPSSTPKFDSSRRSAHMADSTNMEAGNRLRGR